MRYTARKRNAIWRNDNDTRAARRFLADILAGGEPLIFNVRLRPGQGLICNNVLHSRSAFDNGAAEPARRLIYRLRFLDRVGGTECGPPIERDDREA
jgi:hypothetical protein